MDKELISRLSAGSGQSVRTQIRLPTDIHEGLVKAAAASGRSLNAEMVERLKSTVIDDLFKSAGLEIQDSLPPAKPEEMAMLRLASVEAGIEEQLRTIRYVIDSFSQITGVEILTFKSFNDEDKETSPD